jgi:Tfp pilus assembly protein PilF
MVRARGQTGHAIQLLEKAAAAAPDDPAVLCDLGLALKAAGRLDEAVETLSRVVTLAPHAPEAHANLGAALNAMGRSDDAVAAFICATELRPNDPELRYNLGNGLLAAGRIDEAETAFRRTLEILPSHSRARINLGTAFKESGRYDEAIGCFRQVLTSPTTDRDACDAGWNLALLLLAQGRFQEGWRLYEWRRAIPGFAVRRFDAPAWDGSPLGDRALLVHAEQGLGDTLQFARYLPLLATKGGHSSFLCPPALAPLLSGLRGIPALATDPAGRFDVEAPLLSLPHLLGLAEPYVPPSGVYLAADPSRVARWRERVSRGQRTIGIAWQGSTDYRDDRRRSIPLVAFAPLSRLPGVRLVNLQKGAGADQLAELPWRERITTFESEVDHDGAFVDTAAIMASLDLVVTSDTSIAHLAGALGIPVWVALCHRPDWRWGVAGERSPWYPTMRLFRQERPGDWAGVFAGIAAALTA